MDSVEDALGVHVPPVGEGDRLVLGGLGGLGGFVALVALWPWWLGAVLAGNVVPGVGLSAMRVVVVGLSAMRANAH